MFVQSSMVRVLVAFVLCAATASAGDKIPAPGQPLKQAGNDLLFEFEDGINLLRLQCSQSLSTYIAATRPAARTDASPGKDVDRIREALKTLVASWERAVDEQGATLQAVASAKLPPAEGAALVARFDVQSFFRGRPIHERIYSEPAPQKLVDEWNNLRPQYDKELEELTGLLSGKDSRRDELIKGIVNPAETSLREISVKLGIVQSKPPVASPALAPSTESLAKTLIENPEMYVMLLKMIWFTFFCIILAFFVLYITILIRRSESDNTVDFIFKYSLLESFSMISLMFVLLLLGIGRVVSGEVISPMIGSLIGYIFGKKAQELVSRTRETDVRK